MERAGRVVHVLVYAVAPPRVLLLLRPASRAAGWQGVTGRVEPTDADLAAAALREITEETGLPAPDALEDLAIEREYLGYDHVWYRQRTFAARYATTLPVTRSDEHEDARWVSPEEALAMVRWESDRAALEWLAHRSEAAFK